MIIYTDPQGSEAWLAARRGVITASRFKNCRDRLKNGNPSKVCELYAMDVARERVGGVAQQKFQNAAMRMGTEQEPFARMEYEARTGVVVQEAGFITTPDRLFGASVDGLVGDDGIVEIKTLVSSDTLFTVLAGDISSYQDQCNGALWLLGRQWVDLVAWVPDLNRLVVKRIERDENEIEKLEADLLFFEATVSKYEAMLRKALA